MRAALFTAKRCSRSLAASTGRLSSRISVPAGAATVLRSLSTVAVTGGERIAQLAEELPFKDIVRYEHKNVKWTLETVNRHSEDLAAGLLETGLIPGDVVLSWLPNHFAEQHILEFACSKSGLILYKLDPAQATKDQEAAKASLAKALEITKANVLISQQAGDDVNYARLCEQVIPEIQIFNVEDGELFISPRFPHLRFPIHTGFGYGEMAGMIPYKDMLTSNGQLPHYLERFELTPQTPLMGELIMGPDGLPSLGKVLSNEEVQSSGVWPTYSAILNKEYQEIEGVGVIF